MSIKDWTVVWRGDRIAADLVAASLEADGLTVEVFGDNAYGVGIDLTEARIMVPDDQAEAARRLIDLAEASPPEPPDSDV